MSPALDLTGFVLPETVEEQSIEDGHRGRYLLQPLERGFGHTIGNSIRRILLSSLPGAAVWAIRADGVQHEHQTLEDVAEDVHQMIQNVKNVVLILDPDIDEAKLELSVTKAGVVKASKITKHPGVKIVNPKQVLFTLQEDRPENRPLNVDLWVNRGRGFVMAEQHELPEDAPVDMIRIDSIYNPVLRANFAVTETRVGERTDFDRLTIEVATNGALEPSTAVQQAAEIARAHLAYLSGVEPPDEGVRPAGDGADGGAARLPLEAGTSSALEQPLEAFEQISARSRNTLEKENIRFLVDVVSRTRDEMLQVPNFGEKSLEEVAEVLAEHGLRFGMELERDEGGVLYVVDDAAENGASGDDEA